MRYTLFLSLLFFGKSYGQPIRCDSGYQWMPSLSTSSLVIEGDMCMPDSVCNKLWLIFRENMCGERGSFTGGDRFTHSVSPKWINDTIGCVTSERFSEKVKGKWKEISACRYYYFSGTVCSTMAFGDSVMKTVPCCGHIHTSEPLK